MNRIRRSRVATPAELLEQKQLLTVIEWGGNIDGDWNNPVNWSPTFVPGPGDDVVIDADDGIAYEVDLNVNAVVNSLTVNSADATLDIQSGRSLAVNQASSIDDGIVTLNGSGRILGNGTLTNRARIDVLGTSTFILAPFQQDGVVNIGESGGTTNPTLTTNSVTNSGTIQLGTDTISSPRWVVNTGQSFTNTAAGTIDVEAAVTGSAEITGTFLNEGSLDVKADFDLDGVNATITNRGTITVDAGAEMLIGDFSTVTFVQESGTLTIDGAFETDTDIFRFIGGTINGAAKPIIHAGMLDLDPAAGAVDVIAERTVTLGGDIGVGQVVRVQNDGAAESELLSVNGFTNSGTIVFEADADSSTERRSKIRVVSGTLTNAASGLIQAIDNIGRISATTFVNAGNFEMQKDTPFFLNTLVNSGTFTIGTDLDLINANMVIDNFGDMIVEADAVFRPNRSTITMRQNGGTLQVDGSLETNGDFEFNGGDLSGNPVVITNGDLHYGSNLVNAETIIARGTVDVETAIPANQTLIAQAFSGTTQLRVDDGFTNNGTIRLERPNGSSQTVSIVAASGGGEFINGPTGTLDIQPGGQSPFSITTLTNQGMLNIGTDVEYRRSNGLLVNEGQVNVPVGTSLSLTNNGFGAADLTNASGTLTVDGLLEIQGTLTSGGGAFAGAGDIRVVSGTLDVVEGNTTTFDISIRGNSSLNGDLAAGQALRIQTTNASATLVNVDDGFTNAGTILVDAVDGATGLASIQRSGGTITNAADGVVDIGPGGTFRVIAANFVNAGTFDLGRDFTTPTNLDIANTGNFGVEAGATLALAGFNASRPQFIQTDGALTIDGQLSVRIANFTFNGGDIVGVNNPTVLSGALDIADGNDNPVVFDIHGSTTVISGLNANQTLVLEPQGVGSLNVTVPNDFQNAGTIVFEPADAPTATSLLRTVTSNVGAITNTGIIEVRNGSTIQAGQLDNSGTITVDSAFNLQSSIVVNNSGAFDVSGGGSVTLGSNSQFTQPTFNQLSGGTLTNDGAFVSEFQSTFNFNGGTIDGAEPVTVRSSDVDIADGNTAAVHFQIEGTTDLTANLAAGQRIDIAAVGAVGATVTVDNDFTNAGEIFFDISQATTGLSKLRSSISTGIVTNTTTGLIRGNGEVETADVVNQGTLAPGASSGTLTIDADLELQSTSVVAIELGGVTAGTQFDRLQVEHATSLDGELRVDVIDGFVPVAGQTFEAITFPSILGDFATVTGTDIGNGAILEKTLNADDVTLSVISPPGLTIDDVTVTEGDNGTLSAVFTVSLEQTSNPVSVEFATESISADAGEDFTASSGTLNFAANETSKTVSVPIVGDLRDEDVETFRVILSNATNAAIPDPEGVGTILDNNDPEPEAAFADTMSSVAEDGGTLSITVQLDRPSGVATSVVFSVSGGTAIGNGTDFTLANGTLNFAADETSRQIDVLIAEDLLVEGAETIEVTLSNPVRSSLGATNVHTVTINDNDFHPDLLVASSDSPDTADRGRTISVEWVVRNAGQGNATGSLSGRVFLSQDNVLDAGDTILSTRDAASDLPLAAGATFTATENVTIPNVDPGDYFLIFETDSLAQITEDSDTNNTLIEAIEILGADLVVSAANTPAAVTAGTQVGIDFTTKNQGAGEAERIPLNRVFFSDDAILDATDVVLFTAFGSPLIAGQSFNQNGSLDIPEVSPGTYFLIFSVDDSELQVETDETNNLLTQTITVQVADLAVTAATTPATANIGDQISTSFSIENQGDAATTKNRFERILLSTDEIAGADDRIIFTRSSTSDDPLAPGETLEINADVAIPAQIVAGDYFLLFLTDDADREFESDESNNLLSRPIRIEGADLIIESITAPAAAQFGDEIQVQWTVRNTGTLTVDGNLFDQIRLTANVDGSGSVATLLSENAGDNIPLAPGASYTQTFTATLPLNRNSDPGSFFLFGRTDIGGAVTEQSEQNNTIASPIDLTLPRLPDLVITDISIPVTEAKAEDQLEIEWTVTNQGTEDAIGPWQTLLSYVDADNTVAARTLGSVGFNETLSPGESIVRRQVVTIPANPSFEGAARIQINVDSSNNVFEHAGDDDNRFLDDDTFVLSEREFPNLVVSNIIVPSTAVSGEMTDITFTVSNIGNAATSAPVWTDDLFLSLDQAFDPNPGANRGADDFLGSANNVRFLNPGESYTNTIEVTLPVNLDDEFFVFVRTDTSNRVDEGSDEDDNRSISTPMTITLPPAADLQITDIRAPLNIFSEEEFTVTWTVTNTGDGPTESDRVSDRILLSADDQLGGNDFVIGARTHVGILAPGESYTETRTVTTPVGFQGLNVFLLIETDFAGQVFEHVNEQNNVSSRPLNAFLAPPSDLQPVTFDLPATARAGVPVEFSYTATNLGLGQTAGSFWNDSLFLSEDNVLDASDLLLATVGHSGAIGVNDTYQETATGLLPNGLSGDFFVIASIDSSDRVFESIFEGNNVAASSQQITILSQPADLIVSNVVVPETAVSGQTITVEWTVENQGVGDTIVGNWADRIRASVDDVIGNGDDFPLAVVRHGQLLAPGESITGSALVTIPATLAGSFNVYVTADSSGSVFESDETNNDSVFAALNVTQELSDLTITSIDSVSVPPAGSVFVEDDSLRLQWTGRNDGVGVTNATAWRDSVFLSTDQVLDGSDFSLGTVFQGGVLAPGAEYSLDATFNIPNLDGDFHILIRTDRNNDVLESDESNNEFASVGTISIQETIVDLPDLTVPVVNASSTAVSGQQIDVNWTIENSGGPIGERGWFSTIFLSLDEVLDSSDSVLRSVLSEGPLDTDGTLNQSATVDLPRGISGDFFLFVKTDTSGTRSIRELDEGNNVGHDIEPISVQLLPPSDLVVGAIPVPSNAVPGQDISVTYTVTNDGSDTAFGRWSDTLFLSDDEVFDSNDLVLGEVLHIGDLAPGESYAETLTAALPGVAPGEHFVIVRSDIRNQIPEINEDNNIRASLDRVDIEFPELTLGVPQAGQLGDSDFVYFRVDVEAGQTLQIALDSDSADAFNQLFVSFEDIPTRADFDFTANDELGPDQQILVPVTRQGTYFILANGASVTENNDVPFTIEADVLEFSVISTSVSRGANKGLVTLPIRGARLTPRTVASLKTDAGSEIVAQDFRWIDQSEAWVTFDLTDATPGEYDISIADGTSESALTDSFTVTDGPVGELRINVRSPTSVGGGIANSEPRFLVQVEFENVGETDVVSPVISLNSAGASLQVPGQDGTFVQNLLFVGTNRPGDGPAGIIQPGASNTFTFLAQAGAPGGVVPPDGQAGTLATFTATDTDIATVAVVEPLINSIVDDEPLRDLLIDQLLTSIGPDPADLTRAISQNATHLSQLGHHTDDLFELLSFEIAQLTFSSQVNDPVSASDVQAPSVGPESLFERVFNPIAARLSRAGILGIGWTHTWDWALSENADGDVTITALGREFTYQSTGDGQFESAAGDLAALTIEGSRFVHTDRSGDRRLFTLAGQLVRIEDLAENRIDLTYTGLQLTQLQHSNGLSIALDYNVNGSLNRLTDHAGRFTDYAYDASGTFLEQVDSPVGATVYSYDEAVDSPSRALIRSVTQNDGIQRRFEYDTLGRITAEEFGTGPVTRTEYSYDDAGRLTVTDGLGHQTELLLFANGAIGQAYDELGRPVRFTEGTDRRLNEFVVPGGLTYGLQVDEQGQVSEITAPLGGRSQFTYDNSGQLEAATDPNGRALNFAYDEDGHRISAAFADGTQHTAAYDSNGNLTSLTDRAAQQQIVSYTAAGQVDQIAFSDGTSVAYTYDGRGNLLTATDTSGTITYTWNSADLQTRVAYPSGRSLDFTYDARGRRTSTTDQDGVVTRYEFDSLNRLTAVRDTANNLLVAYQYDAIGQLLREDHLNGTFTTYSYDETGQMLTRMNHAPDGSVSTRFEYVWDDLGRQQSVTTTSGRFDYEYDVLNQLIGVTRPDGQVINYEYDAAGNRSAEIVAGIRTDYVLDILGRPVQIGNAIHSYDDNGFLTQIDENGEITSYDYDVRGRLVQIQTPTSLTQYEYDALDNRIAETIDGVRSEFLIDPFGAGNLIGEFDDAGNVTSRYVYGNGLVAAVDAAGDSSFFEFDGLGNTAGVSSVTGVNVASYLYLPFGETLIESEAVANRFQFGGERGGITDAAGSISTGQETFRPQEGSFVSPSRRQVSGRRGSAFGSRGFSANNPTSFASSANRGNDSLRSQGRPGTPGAPGVTSDARNPGAAANPSSDTLSASLLSSFTLGLPVSDNPGTADSDIAATGGFQSDVAQRIQELEGVHGRINEKFGEFKTTLVTSGIQAASVGVLGPGKVIASALNPIGLEIGDGIIDTIIETAASTPKRLFRSATLILFSIDPNDITGPSGFGEEHWVTAAERLPFTIRFENLAEATAPAQRVLVTAKIDRDIDIRTLRLGDFGFGDFLFDVDENDATFIDQTFDFTATKGILVDVEAAADPRDNTVTWLFTALDPATGLLPADPTIGFLPPNNDDRDGEGFVTYSIVSDIDTPTGTEIDSQATIFFDNNAPIDTNIFVNTIDSGRPTSSVNALPALSGGLFEVSWSGDDDDGGSGVASYDIFVSVDDGPFEPFLSGTTATQAPFRADLEHTYRFFSVATDNAGNRELVPDGFDALTRATAGVDDGTAPVTEVNQPERFATSLVFEVSATGSDPEGPDGQAASGLKRIDVFVAIDEGEFEFHTSLDPTDKTFSFNADSNHIYWFRSRGVDHAGNVEDKPLVPEAIVFVGDFDAPETSVSNATPADNGEIELILTGTDSGGSELATFDVFVAIDGGVPSLYASVDAGQPDAGGIHSVTRSFQGLTDGIQHTYTFFTVSQDGVGNQEAEPGRPDQIVTATFNPPSSIEATGIDVQDGAQQRSFVRFVDIDFTSTNGLQDLINSGSVTLERFDLNVADAVVGSGQQVDLSNTTFAAVDNTIRLDFGTNGIGGNAGSSAGDGLYRILIDTDDDGVVDQTFEFFRIFGDADGDGDVDRLDVSKVLRGFRGRSNSAEYDMNGDGNVSFHDILFTSREARLGKSLNDELFGLLDD